MRRGKMLIITILVLLVSVPLYSQTKVKDLKSHYMQDYCWMRFAEIVPEVTDRVILPIGTVEAHGVLAIGADNFIPNNLAELIWDKCNALIAPPINHGFTGLSISQFPGSITVREDVFEEYIYDVMKHLVRSGFKNILIINGHGGNTNPTKKAMARLHVETAAHFMVVDWWKMGWELANTVYGNKVQQSGHGDLEEAALCIFKDLSLLDKKMYEKLGKDNVAHEGTEGGFSMMPAWATSRLPEKGVGYHDFDKDKARQYAEGKAKIIADTFIQAVKRWEFNEKIK